jgi:hypothetical protein
LCVKPFPFVSRGLPFVQDIRSRLIHACRIFPVKQRDIRSGAGIAPGEETTEPHGWRTLTRLGQAQPLWSFVPPGSLGHIDFGEQFPYDLEKAKALLKEAGFDQKTPCVMPL